MRPLYEVKEIFKGEHRIMMNHPTYQDNVTFATMQKLYNVTHDFFIKNIDVKFRMDMRVSTSPFMYTLLSFKTKSLAHEFLEEIIMPLEVAKKLTKAR